MGRGSTRVVVATGVALAVVFAFACGSTLTPIDAANEDAGRKKGSDSPASGLDGSTGEATEDAGPDAGETATCLVEPSVCAKAETCCQRDKEDAPHCVTRDDDDDCEHLKLGCRGKLDCGSEICCRTNETSFHTQCEDSCTSTDVVCQSDDDCNKDGDKTMRCSTTTSGPGALRFCEETDE